MFCSAAGSRHVNPPDANAHADVAPEKAVESSVSENENRPVLNPKLLAEEKGIESVGDQAQENRASVNAGR